jgi:Zn-finger nucleic acid-binding protein
MNDGNKMKRIAIIGSLFAQAQMLAQDLNEVIQKPEPITEKGPYHGSAAKATQEQEDRIRRSIRAREEAYKNRKKK